MDERERECVCLCVCVRERERWREKCASPFKLLPFLQSCSYFLIWIKITVMKALDTESASSGRALAWQSKDPSSNPAEAFSSSKIISCKLSAYKFIMLHLSNTDSWGVLSTIRMHFQKNVLGTPDYAYLSRKEPHAAYLRLADFISIRVL